MSNSLDNISKKAGTTAENVIGNFTVFLTELDESFAIDIIKKLAEPTPSNLPATAFNKAVGEARRKEIALKQYKEDVQDAELKLEMLHLGIQQLEVKYR